MGTDILHLQYPANRADGTAASTAASEQHLLADQPDSQRTAGKRRCQSHRIIAAFGIPSVALCVVALTLLSNWSTPDAALLAHSDPSRVTTLFGDIAGTTLQHSREFLGIPYALPPLGPHRWAPAQLWSGPYPSELLDATSFGPMCPQKFIFNGEPSGIEMDEDCLTLNVYTPHDIAQLRPVMVFLHGGGFLYGSSHYRALDMQTYNGSSLAQKYGAVVVTVNYRLGALGYMALRGQSARLQSTGSWGLWDQLIALEWVQLNIEGFGGNPSKVNLFGASGGAISICALLTVPRARGLFHSATMQSSHCEALPMWKALDTADRFAVALGCNSSDVEEEEQCLRLKPWQDILDLQLANTTVNPTPFGWFPVVDGTLLAAQPWMLALAGALQQNVPIIMGTDQNEGSWFSERWLGGPWVGGPDLKVSMGPDNYTAAMQGYLTNMAVYFPCLNPVTHPSTLQGALLMYPPHPSHRDNAQRYSEFYGDVRYVCPTRHFLEIAAQWAVPLFGYSFRHRCLPGVKPQDWGVYHGSELHYIWNQPSPHCSFTEEEQELAATMSGLWWEFASTQRMPDEWPRYSLKGDSILVVEQGGTLRQQSGYKQKQCDFWREAMMECPID